MNAFNKKVMSTAGLFVAFVGLTSFKPSPNNYVAMAKEDSITLTSQTTNVSRIGNADRDTQSRKSEDKVRASREALKGTQPPRAEDAKPVQSQEQTAGNGVLNDIINKDKPITAQPATTAAEGQAPCADGTCADSKKNSTVLDIAKILKKIEDKQELTADEKLQFQQFSANLSGDATLPTTVVTAENKNFCDGEGTSSYQDYSSRASCFLDTEKNLKKKSEDYSSLADEMNDFISEVTLDEDLKPRQVNSILRKLGKSKIVRSDRERDLKGTIRVALNYNDAQKNKVAFERNIERSADEISNIDDQLRQLSQYNNGMNPQLNYEQNMLQIQRKEAVYNLEREVAGFQQTYRMSLPKATADDSELVATLRDNMSAEYNDLVSPVESVLSDKRLTSLDSQSFSIPNIQNGQQIGQTYPLQSGVYTAQNNNNGIPQLNQAGQMYSNQDPNMLATLTPQQQIQQLRGQLQNGINTGISYQGQMMQQQPGLIQQGQIPQGPQQGQQFRVPYQGRI